MRRASMRALDSVPFFHSAGCHLAFLLGSCRRLANAVPSPSISSGFNPDIGSADPLASMRRASMRTFLPIPNAGKAYTSNC